uniref:Uncharacterized protein n=1 Tax=Anguilla anguilla TaxID=7936 RepID=A0A0E9S1E2_ANGAN
MHQHMKSRSPSTTHSCIPASTSVQTDVVKQINLLVSLESILTNT